jgi:glycosyltransferase involved in cell wall biosynthesis
LKILVIVSACNEAASLEFFLPQLLATAGSLPISANIIVIDDGSTDGTAKMARAKGCQVIMNGENLGIGASLRKGYEIAQNEGYDATVSMDADGQHDERLLPLMIDHFVRGADIVVASRYHKDSKRMGVPMDRDLLNIAVTAQIRVVTGWEVSDPLCGFWVMRDRKSVV